MANIVLLITFQIKMQRMKVTELKRQLVMVVVAKRIQLPTLVQCLLKMKYNLQPY